MTFFTSSLQITSGARPIVIPRTEVQQIIADVAHKHGLTYADILAQKRSKAVVCARHDAMAAVYETKPHLSLAQMGKMFRRDPKTVHHGLRKRGLK